MSKHTKSNNRRKAAAVALAVLGVTGLTLASAAQLNLSTPASVQAGVTDVIADCQPAGETIAVTFAAPELSGGTYTTDTVNLSNISTQCAGRNYKVALLGAGDQLLISEVASTVSGTAISVPLTGAATQDSVAKIALTIY